jgi:hypothetical protein
MMRKIIFLRCALEKRYDDNVSVERTTTTKNLCAQQQVKREKSLKKASL